MLLAQDALVALKLALDPRVSTYAELSHDLGLSPSQVHAAVRRAGQAKLLVPGTKQVDRRALVEFLVHGLKYMVPAEPGPVMRGTPTAHSASPLRELLGDTGEPLVWPNPAGSVRGESIEPLCKSAPGAALRDPDLYAGLALVDALRCGRARERKIAAAELSRRILRG